MSNEVKRLIDEAERILSALQQDGLPKGKYAEFESAIREAAQQSVEPTLDTSPVFVPKPCVTCGQMVCNH